MYLYFIYNISLIRLIWFTKEILPMVSLAYFAFKRAYSPGRPLYNKCQASFIIVELIIEIAIRTKNVTQPGTLS